MRICSPPTRWPCHYGIDTPRREELIAARQSVEEIRDYASADSLAYLSLAGTLAALGGGAESYCTACWSGEYRVAVGKDHPRQTELFPIQTVQR